MKRKFLPIAFMLVVLVLLAIRPINAQQYLQINLNDGTKMEISIADIQKVTFDLNTGVQHPDIVQQLLKLKLFPNPARGNIIIDYNLPEKGLVEIGIYNLSGMLMNKINQGIQQPGDYQYRMNTQHLPAGTYICRIQNYNQFVSEKIIINP